MLGSFFAPVSMAAVFGMILYYLFHYMKNFRSGRFDDQELARLKQMESQEKGIYKETGRI